MQLYIAPEPYISKSEAGARPTGALKLIWSGPDNIINPSAVGSPGAACPTAPKMPSRTARYARYSPRQRRRRRMLADRSVRFPNDVLFLDHIRQGDLEQVRRFIRAQKVSLATIHPSGEQAPEELARGCGVVGKPARRTRPEAQS